MANAPYTVEVNGCGPTGLHRCHDTFEQACRAWKEARRLEPVVGPDGKRYWPWGTPPNPRYKWVGEQCNRYQSPGGRRFAGPGGIGVEQTEGYGAPCPEPTQEPTPPPGPTPTPDPDCGPLTWKVVGLCTNRKPCTCDGRDYGRPMCVRERDAPTHVLYTAVAMYHGREVHKGDACWPGSIPTFRDGHVEGRDDTGWFVLDPNGVRIVSGKNHRGAALGEAVTAHGAVPSWQERVISGDHLDYGWALSEGYNTTGRDHDFRTENELGVQAHGTTGCIRISVR